MSKISYRKLVWMRRVDFLFQCIPYMAAAALLVEALYKMVCFNIFVYEQPTLLKIVLPSIPPMHAATVANISAFYIYMFHRLRYLLPHIRVPLAATFTAMGPLWYDFTYAVCDYVVCGYGLPLIQLSLFLACCMIMGFYTWEYRVFTLKTVFAVSMSIHLALMAALASTGFFQQIHVFEAGGADPHSWLWLISKVSGIWLWATTVRGPCLEE